MHFSTECTLHLNNCIFLIFARLGCADACFMYLDLLDVARVYCRYYNYLPHQPNMYIDRLVLFCRFSYFFFFL